MKKTLCILIPIALLAIGCSVDKSGDVETYKAKPEAGKDSMAGAIQNNPNIPDSAKKAVLGQKR